jgi:hypothetical protein
MEGWPDFLGLLEPDRCIQRALPQVVVGKFLLLQGY